MKFFPKKSPYSQRLANRFNVSRRLTLMALGFAGLALGVPEAGAFIFAGGTPASAPGGTITKVAILNTTTVNGPSSTLTNEPVRFGLILPDNDTTGCPVGKKPEIRVSGGSALASQSVAFLSKWASGRPKHVNITTVIPSLAATASITDPTVDNGQATTALFDIATVSGSPGAGITLGAFQSYLASGHNMTGSVTDLNGVVYNADAITAFGAVNTTPSAYFQTPTYWGTYISSETCTCFIASMPFTSATTTYIGVLHAFFIAFVHHNSSGTISRVEWYPIHENGVLGIQNPNAGVLNANIPYLAADWSINGVAKWARAAVTPNATLNVPLGMMGPAISGGFAPPRYMTARSNVYLTNVLDGFNFNLNNMSLPIAIGKQILYPISFQSQAWVQVTSGGSGYTSAPTITNTGGSAVLRAVIDPTAGTVINVIVITPGTIGTVSSSGGGGTGLTMSVQAAANSASCAMVQDAGAICNPQTGTGGSLTLNGKNCVTISGVTKGYPRFSGVTQVSMFSDSDNTGCSITISGIRNDGGSSPATFTGPAANKYVDCGSWDIITGITRTGTSTNLCVGIGGVTSGSQGICTYESAPRSITTGITATAGNWKVIGGIFPANGHQMEEIWDGGVPRHYVGYQPQYLIDSRVIPNYCISEMSQTKLALDIPGEWAKIQAYSRSANTSLYPDSYDFNKPCYLNWGTMTNWGYILQESVSGENPGLGTDTVWDLNWLAYGGLTAWNTTKANAQRTFNIRSALRDETTGQTFDPNTYQSLGSGSYIAGSTSSGMPCFYTIDPSQAVPQSNGGGFGATFSWQQNDTAHCNVSCNIMWWLTCNPAYFMSKQMEASMRWMNVGTGPGLGLNRCWAGVGPSQIRVTAQSLIKSVGQAVVMHPTEVTVPLWAPKSMLKAVNDKGYHNTVTNKGLYDLYVVGPDLTGTMPADRGNFHIWNDALNAGASTGYQIHYANNSMLNVMENGELSSEGQQFLKWSADLSIQYWSNPTQINPRYIYQVEWVSGGDAVTNPSGVQINGLDGLWSFMDYVFPGPLMNGSPVLTGYQPPSTTLTLGATTGTGITVTASQATFFNDAVGAYISSNIFQATTFQTSSPWNVTATNHGIPVDGQPYAVVCGLGYRANGAMPPQPLVYGRQTYYVVAQDASTLKFYSDAGATTQIQFTTGGSGGVTVSAGLAQIVSVGADPTVAYSSITVDIILPFLTTTLNSNGWVMSIPPPSANNSGHAQAFPQGGTGVNAYILLYRASVAAAAAFPEYNGIAQPIWDQSLLYGQNDSVWLGNSSGNDYTGQANRVVKYRS